MNAFSPTALSAGTSISVSEPDALLIRVCYQFAEAEFEDWYRYCTAPDGEEDDKSSFDRDTLNWIAATPATTSAGWQAKALACAAFNRNMYDDHTDDQEIGTPLLAALLREMAAPTRNAILLGLERKYGPLPDGYTPDWRWVGRTAA